MLVSTPSPTLRCCLAAGFGLAVFLAGCSRDWERAPGSAVESSSATRLSRQSFAASMSAPFGLSQQVERVRMGYRREGDGFRGGPAAYAAEVRGGKVTVRPIEPRDSFARRAGVETDTRPAFELETVSVARGFGRPVPFVKPELNPDGSLLLRRGDVVERLRNGEQGLEQSWELARKPAGKDDWVVRVRVNGLRYVGTSVHGLHFQDPATGLGFRYGTATWVGADGRREEIGAGVYAGGEVAFVVPAGVLEGSAYPAVLDPVIAPELGMDQLLASPGVYAQGSPAVASDGTGHLVVWADYRNGGPASIYAYGEVLDTQAIGVAWGGKGAERRDLACDGTSCLVLWGDRGSGNFNLFGAHIRNNGEVFDHFTIASTPLDERHPSVAWDGTSYTVVWEDGDQGIAAAQLGPAGGLLKGPVLVSATGKAPAVKWGSESYLVVWEGPGIQGTRMSRGLELLVDEPIAIAAATGAPKRPALEWDGATYLVVWEDYRTGVSALYGRRLGGSGVSLGGESVISSKTGVFPSVAWNGTTHLVIWETEWRIVGARVEQYGPIDDPPIGMSERTPFVGDPGWQSTVAWGGNDFLVVWTSRYDDSNSNSRMFAARVDEHGFVLDPSGISVSVLPATHRILPAAGSDGADYLVVWHDYRRLPSDIYGARIREGHTLDEFGLPIAVSDSTEQSPRIAWNGSTYLVVWNDIRDGEQTVYGARVSRDGTVLDVPGFPVAPFWGGESRTALASDGTDFLVISGGAVYGTRISAQGEVLDEPGTIISITGSAASIVWGGTSYFVVWNDPRNGDPDIYGSRVSSDGTVLDEGGIPIATGEGKQRLPVVAWDGTSYVVVWFDEQNGGTTIRMARVSPAGVVLDPDGILIQEGGDRPSVASNGRGTTLIAYNLAVDGRTHLESRLVFSWPDGAACEDANACASGHCVDGFCCDGACAGQCEACDVHGSEGSCTPITGAPHGARPACTSDGSACGGLCDGEDAASCAYPTDLCRPASCRDGTATPAAFCDGAGSCPDAQTIDCAPYRCGAEACEAGCSDHDDCVPGHHCSAGACRLLLESRESCTDARQCASDMCVDGVCCESACTGQCEACDLEGSKGECAPVAGAPRGGRAPCAGDGVCQGRCDGETPDRCTFPPATTLCSPATCTEGAAQASSTCDGAGQCEAGEVTPCGAYACSSGGCLTVCHDSGECAPGFACDEGACVERPTESSQQGCGCSSSSSAPTASLVLLLLGLLRRPRTAHPTARV